MNSLTIHLQHAAPAATYPARDADADAATDTRAPHVAAMFGLGLDDEPPRTIVPPTPLTLAPGQLVFITGPSGGGKSTLLRLIAAALTPSEQARVVPFDALATLPDRPLVDCFDHPLPVVLQALSRAGLGDAFIMLRRPAELSDGQRYRLRLAQTMLALRAHTTSPPDAAPTAARRTLPLTVVLADEFGATLDRLTAAVVAENLRKWVTASGVCFIAATTHDDLLEPLCPDILIHKPLGSSIRVLARGEVGPVRRAYPAQPRSRKRSEAGEKEN